MAYPGGIREQLRKAQYTPRVEERLRELTSAPAAHKVVLLQELQDYLIAPLVAPYIRDVAQMLFEDESSVRHQAIALLRHLYDVNPKPLKLVVPGLATRLNDESDHVRYDAMELLHQITLRDPTTTLPFLEPVLERLGDRDAKMRELVTATVVELGTRSPSTVVPALVKLLNPAQADLCGAATHALKGIARKKPAALSRAAAPLVTLLTDKRKELYEIAAELLVLGATRKVKSIPKLLLKPLVDRELDSDARLRAINVAAEIAEHDGDPFVPAVKQLGRDLRHRKWELREGAAQLLGQIGRKDMAVVKEAIPALAHATTDSDDLVRAAAVKSLELIKVSSLDYTAIQKASEALHSARFVVRSACNFGINVKQAEKLLKDARGAFDRGDYDRSYDYAKRAESIAAKAEKRSEEVREVIRTAKRTLQSIRRKGIDVRPARKMLAQAEKLMQRHRFKEARLRAEKAMKAARKLAREAKPDLVISGRLEQPLLPDTWNELPVKLKNLGNAAAWEVTLNFSEGFAVRGNTSLETVEAGRSLKLSLQLYPKSKGLVPVAVEVVYHSFEGDYFSGNKHDIVEVGESSSFEPRDLFVSGVAATVLPEAEQPQAVTMRSRFADTRSYFVVCENCGTRIPSNFRICGRCGQHLARPGREPSERRSTCRQCGTPLTPGQQFCGQCGNLMEIDTISNCGQCGTILTPLQKFCGQCGGPAIAGPTVK